MLARIVCRCQEPDELSEIAFVPEELSPKYIFRKFFHSLFLWLPLTCDNTTKLPQEELFCPERLRVNRGKDRPSLDFFPEKHRKIIRRGNAPLPQTNE